MAERNRQVTHGYFLLSERLRTLLGEEASWPTFATWASAQAGRTIRKEDLLRELERRLGDSERVQQIVRGPLKFAATRFFQSVLALNPFERSSQAVSRGNIKVYAEIGAVLAGLLRIIERKADATEITAFLAALQPGPPPEGQDYLREALPAYLTAGRLPPGKARSELILLGNVLIGLHEQTRLQPEIEQSMDGSVWDFVEAKERLRERLLPGGGGPLTWLLNWWRRWRISPHLQPLVEEAQRLTREILTQRMMVLELPGGAIKLGQDLGEALDDRLREIENPELKRLLEQVRAGGALTGTGALNWADFNERMHFIAGLFRARQFDQRLFSEPKE